MNKADKGLHPKIKNIIYNLSHDRYLQKSHTAVSIGIALSLGVLGGMATYIIEGDRDITPNIIILTSIFLSLIFAVSSFGYITSKKKRIEKVNEIGNLNKEDVDSI